MRILFVVPYVPNLVRVRPYNFIRALSARGHHVTVFTVWADEQEQADIAHLREICAEVVAHPMPRGRSLWNCVQALPGKAPLQSVYSWQPALMQHLTAHPPYDVAHVEHLRGSRYGLYLKQNTTLPVVWDSVDCITQLFEHAVANSGDRLRRWRSQMDLERTRWYEGWLLGQFEHVLVTSPKDQAALEALSQTAHAPVSVVGNGVDLAYFREDTAVVRDLATLIVSGKMSYHANIAMTTYLVHDIMPHVWAERPDARLMIVGKDPTREIQALAADSRITVTGTVEHLPPYLQRATIAIAPLRYGAGIQNKVLEAMACATPVITTAQAMSALQATPGQNIVVANDTIDYARHILRLLSEPAWRYAIGQAGRRYVETHHHWDSIAARLENIYALSSQVIARNSKPLPDSRPSPIYE
jgi:polysaccharide biosynthesis protein PslH